MTRANEQLLIAFTAFVLIMTFCGGILAAFGTHDWRWLGLSALAFVILVGNARS